ncbi:2-(3-amino-3-carboxypropyl)histidine synthase subunit 2-like [Physella acuta]|uniref:2-(3-amino-3-carboxypropyl)histidine synthase subunit 2-like n=1 Tax=Physella acuta TaxID=109671 RepID=UPI0027DCBF83|nr:2-(3-amino-3-carboxypropyl)histidine synthase subunit 2-like [Physella acuta]XP_059165987.1 2-(3-amino-3-carboxypropyl)histidine synthase subunit 2-like [Physella acuta]XP_059165995.1 2-(3-amino-3-carboxypropyl)histidine synthase subunit 2-like [Physella acuta]
MDQPVSATPFCSGDDVIARKLELTCTSTSRGDLHDVYDVDNTIQWILLNGFKMVALQFPDKLLVDAPGVVALIQNKVSDVTVFILGDTSYGSCCVDEVGALHYKADCVIHYDHACLSPTQRLPVYYVYGKSSIDVDNCINQINETCTDRTMKVVLVFDTEYLHVTDELFKRLQNHFSSIILSKQVDTHHTETHNACLKQSPSLPTEDNKNPLISPDTSKSVLFKCGRKFELPTDEQIDSYSILFIGDTQSPTLTNLMMTLNKCPFYSYDPAKNICRRESFQVNKALMKRYYLIERAKDARIVGLLAGTLGVTRYKEMLEQLKCVLRKAGKKTYTFVVGKLNPAKLANFAEVDVFVLVSCPESVLLDQSEFYRPIVSPLEMDIACNQAREWTGSYSTDFTELLPGGAMHIEAPDISETDEATPDVSLISNKVRTIGIRDQPDVSQSTSTELSLRSEQMSVAITADDAGEYLASRSWKGLEQKLGETPVVKATEGQYGIASYYQHEVSK